MADEIAAFVARSGCALVFAAVYLECLGVAVPGSALVLAGAFLAERGMLPLWAVVGAGAGAMVLAGVHGHLRGRWEAVRGSPEAAGGAGLSERLGAPAVLIARFVFGPLVPAARLAAARGIPWARFLVLEVAGALFFAGAVCAAAYALAASWRSLEERVGPEALYGAATGAALLAVAVAGASSLRARGPKMPPPRASWRREALLGLSGMAALAFFSLIAGDVAAGRAGALDERLMLAIHRFSGPVPDALMRAATSVGNPSVLFAVSIAAIACCIGRRSFRTAFVVVAVGVATEVLNDVLKLAFARGRPALWPGIQVIPTPSFPSGHAMGAIAIFGIAALVAARLWPGAARTAMVLTASLVALIGVSRTWLGVHWPTDVLGGFAAGGFLLLSGMRALAGIETRAARAEAG